MQHNFSKTTVLLFFLFFIHTNGKAQFCADFTTSYELDRCFEQEIEKRINAFSAEHGIDFEEIQLAFNSYLVKAGFTTADSIGVGYRNFLRQLYAPVDKTELISTLDSDFLQHLMLMVGKLDSVCLDSVRDLYLAGRKFSDFIEGIEEKCINEGFQDRFGRACEKKCPWPQLVISTLYFRHFVAFDDAVEGRIFPWISTHKEMWTKEIYEKPIYQFSYLVFLSLISHLNHIINGEAIFFGDLLDNRRERQRRILVDSEQISGTRPNFVAYIYTPSGELQDIRFVVSGKLLEYDDVCEKLRNGFRNLTFPVGIHNGKEVKYAGWKNIQYTDN